MSSSPDWKPCIAPGMRLQLEPAQNAWVLLYPEGMVRLNASASEVLRRCDGARSLAAITAELEARFRVEGIASHVRQLVDEGARRGWLV